jgi:predicted transcriptional regulator of viral defense system
MTGAFDAEQTSQVLGIGHDEASQLLVYLARRGWLSRVRRGLYVATPLDARHPGEGVEDPWVFAERIFSPCYIGGWSACTHWGLTEQAFRTVMVVTARRVRHRNLKIQGVPFHLTVRPEDALFGTVRVWRGGTRVVVSDPSRTIVDSLDVPSLGGGIRSVVGVLGEYLRGEHRNDQLLLDYGDRLANRAVFKRLGYLLERSGVAAPELVQACLERRSSGLVALDPSVGTRGRIVRRWGLRVNDALGTQRGEW